jgi:hypothetical protein
MRLGPGAMCVFTKGNIPSSQAAEEERIWVIFREHGVWVVVFEQANTLVRRVSFHGGFKQRANGPSMST